MDGNVLIKGRAKRANVIEGNEALILCGTIIRCLQVVTLCLKSKSVISDVQSISSQQMTKCNLVIAGDMKGNPSRCDDLVSKFIDTKAIIPDLPVNRLRALMLELDILVEDYDREMAIIHLAGNYTSSSHLGTVILRGKNDEEIKEIIASVRKDLVSEIESRKT